MACSSCASDCRCAVVAADTSITVTGTGSAVNPYQVSANVCESLRTVPGTNREMDSLTDRVVAINGAGDCELIKVVGGPTGATGADGTPGVGVPTGGAALQVLGKDTGTDYDTSWQDLPDSLLVANNLSDLASTATARDNLQASVFVCTSGTRPGSPYAGMMISETDTGHVRRRNLANTVWELVFTFSQSFTATFSSTGTPPNLGTGGSSTGFYRVSGGWAMGTISTTWGTSGISVGTGEYTWQLPLNPVAGLPTYLAGVARITDSGTGISTNAQAIVNTSGLMTLRFPKPAAFAASGIGVDTFVGAAEPVVPAINDRYEIMYQYPLF